MKLSSYAAVELTTVWPTKQSLDKDSREVKHIYQSFRASNPYLTKPPEFFFGGWGLSHRGNVRSNCSLFIESFVSFTSFR